MGQRVELLAASSAAKSRLPLIAPWTLPSLLNFHTQPHSLRLLRYLLLLLSGPDRLSFIWRVERLTEAKDSASSPLRSAPLFLAAEPPRSLTASRGWGALSNCCPSYFRPSSVLPALIILDSSCRECGRSIRRRGPRYAIVTPPSPVSATSSASTSEPWTTHADFPGSALPSSSSNFPKPMATINAATAAPLRLNGYESSILRRARHCRHDSRNRTYRQYAHIQPSLTHTLHPGIP